MLCFREIHGASVNKQLTVVDERSRYFTVPAVKLLRVRALQGFNGWIPYTNQILLGGFSHTWNLSKLCFHLQPFLIAVILRVVLILSLIHI